MIFDTDSAEIFSKKNFFSLLVLSNFLFIYNQNLQSDYFRTKNEKKIFLLKISAESLSNIIDKL